jgi:branched-chain amino acid transport system substrate-binding protein
VSIRGASSTLQFVSRTRLLAVAAAGILVVAACSDDDAAPVTTPEAAPTTTPAPAVDADGVLTIGVLLPSTDTVFGTPLVEAATLAVDRINAAGGVLGRPVEVVVADEGTTTATTTESIQSLLENDVDAIVGPASSTTALGTLSQIVASGTVACSPTASAIALDGFPDDDLFFRTIPSDSLQARAIGEAAIETGAVRASIVHVDDGYGRALADAVTDTLIDGAMAVGDTLPITDGDDDYSDEARRLLESGANVAILLAGEDVGTRFLTALDRLDNRALATVIVNDALRSPVEAARIASLTASLRDRIVGLGPQAESDDAASPFDPPGPFATNAYDCVNLIALATVRAESDAPRNIAEQISSVSSSGSPCASFGDCVAAIDQGLQVDYDGPTGLVEISARSGDPSRAVFDRFQFDETGQDRLERKVIVG